MAKRFSSSKGPSQRQLRAGELVRHALVDILMREELHEPALSGVSVTVTEVRPSPDLRHATVYCTALGGGDVEEVIAALNEAAPHLRGLLGRQIEMKFTPSLTFRRDGSFEEAARIDDLLARPEVRRDLAADEED